MEAVSRLIADAGIGGRRVRAVVALLAQAPQTVASLVETSGVDRRTVEAVLAALGSDLVDAGDGRLALATAASASAASASAANASAANDSSATDSTAASASASGEPTPQWRGYEALLDGHGDLVGRLRELITAGPAARRALDHVSATAETVALRALWLDATFELGGARVLCVGDHDLTSLALAQVNPAVEVTVVDVDDAVLDYIDQAAAANVRCRWSDLRFGLPASVHGCADLVVTDPPYTPEGVRLFLARGLQGLRDHDQARLVLAYGYGEQPALGVKVQEAVTGLGLAYEAVLPGFNRYHGAQAIGSRSDLYLLRPTARSRRLGDPARLGIYTHGRQSLEAGADAPLGELAEALLEAAAGPEHLPVSALVGPGWPSAPVVALRDLLGSAQPPAALTRHAGAVAVDLRADPGPWLLRVLLATNATRLAILVPNNHPDLADERSQRLLAGLVEAKYRLRLRRSSPGPRHAIVEATARSLDGSSSAVRAVLERAHGKVGNIWREALAGAALTRNEARERIRTIARPGVRNVLDERLLALPRHRIADLVADVAASAAH